MSAEQDKILNEVTTNEYKYGFYTDVEIDSIPKGLNEDIISMISGRYNMAKFGMICSGFSNPGMISLPASPSVMGITPITT